MDQMSEDGGSYNCGMSGCLCFPGAYVGAGVGLCSAASHALHAQYSVPFPTTNSSASSSDSPEESTTAAAAAAHLSLPWLWAMTRLAGASVDSPHQRTHTRALAAPTRLSSHCLIIF